jgi:hypothetical protein
MNERLRTEMCEGGVWRKAHSVKYVKTNVLGVFGGSARWEVQYINKVTWVEGTVQREAYTV